jgi:hypothetical protein
MKYVVGLAIFVSLIAAWVLLRPWLECQPWMAGFFRAIEPFERIFYRKSETVLWARAKVFTGVALSTMTQLQGIDITLLLPLIPDQYDAYVIVLWNFLPMAISAMGLMDEYMRVKDTTKPIEVVAVPDKVLEERPDVAEKVARFEEAKVEAVAAIKQAEKAA